MIKQTTLIDFGFEVIRYLKCYACGSPNAVCDPRNNGLWYCPDCGANNHWLESEFG